VVDDGLDDRVDVSLVAHRRQEHAAVCVVERGGERVEVGGHRRRAGAPERGDDVDALAGAREQDGRHGARG